jgi:transketolase
LGLALAVRDRYGAAAPRVHIVEGEGGLTPGRVAEALAMAGTAGLDNATLHLDWNQASIDSNRVCRDGDAPGDYVQWNPMELFYLHDWNVIYVEDGTDFAQILAAQRLARNLESTQPTAVIYRTVKGWQYGIEGKASHGAGHKLCSEGFYTALAPLVGERRITIPSCSHLSAPRCAGEEGPAMMERCFWETLGVLRDELARRGDTVAALSARLRASRDRLDRLARRPRAQAPRVDTVYETARFEGTTVPEALALRPGASTTLRAELGNAIDYLNRKSGGAFLIAAADLLGSTSVDKAASGFPGGYFHTASNPESRTLSVGGICEDAMAGLFSGVAGFGHHIGVASSYAAFLAPLGHIASRLHAIGSQAREARTGEPYNPMILVCAHAGLKTGEDGPTHADPQALQLLEENFPPGTAMTLTPWEPQEIWPLLAAALVARPAVIAPFVTRPNEIVPDRAKLGLPPAAAARAGVYALRRVSGRGDGTIVLQESGATLAFVHYVLPRLDREGVELNVFHVSSAELFDALPEAERRAIFPEELAEEAMGITGFTLPTLYRWVRSDRGRAHSLHPFRKGTYLGSGQGQHVLEEAGLDGPGQMDAVRKYLDALVKV